jgi:hypothetical protein
MAWQDELAAGVLRHPHEDEAGRPGSYAQRRLGGRSIAGHRDDRPTTAAPGDCARARITGHMCCSAAATGHGGGHGARRRPRGTAAATRDPGGSAGRRRRGPDVDAAR